MASKILVNIPGVPFPTMPVKKSHSGELMASSLLLTAQDYACRAAQLEHSLKFLQDQHQMMLSSLHQEIESLRERNRDLQFQLIFNKDHGVTKTKQNSPAAVEEKTENCKSVEAAARGEARAAEARALQLQQLLDAQTERIRSLELREREPCRACGRCGDGGGESPESLRARLAEAERLVRRLRAEAERQRRELHCMKSSLSASLRMSGAELGFSNLGYRHHDYSFPPLPQHLWPEAQPDRELQMLGVRGRGRRPVTLPELQPGIHAPPGYPTHNTRPRVNGYEYQKSERKRQNHHNGSVSEPVRTNAVDLPQEVPAGAPTEQSGARRGRRQHRRGAAPDHT